MSKRRAWSDNELRCSFCRKSQDVVGKLISSPSDYPRAYICDECIAVCNSILEDDRTATPPPSAGRPIVRHPAVNYLWGHPMAKEFMGALEDWIVREHDGRDSSQALAEMRRIAALMMTESPAS